jgi:hypothetical protein
MNFQWEQNNAKLLRSMKVPPQKKLEWLYAMHAFARRTLKGKNRRIFFAFRTLQGQCQTVL